MNAVLPKLLKEHMEEHPAQRIIERRVCRIGRTSLISAPQEVRIVGRPVDALAIGA